MRTLHSLDLAYPVSRLVSSEFCLACSTIMNFSSPNSIVALFMVAVEVCVHCFRGFCTARYNSCSRKSRKIEVLQTYDELIRAELQVIHFWKSKLRRKLHTPSPRRFILLYWTSQNTFTSQKNLRLLFFEIHLLLFVILDLEVHVHSRFY